MEKQDRQPDFLERDILEQEINLPSAQQFKRPHNSKLPAKIEFGGGIYEGPTHLFSGAYPSPAVTLNTFRFRISRYYSINGDLPEEAIGEALYLTTDEFKSRYGVRKTWVKIDGSRIDAGSYFEENRDQAAVRYKTFRSRVTSLNPGEFLDWEKFKNALTMNRGDWHTFYGGGRHREFVYHGGQHPEHDGKAFHGIAAFLKTIGRYGDRANIWSRLKLRWSLDRALFIPFTRTHPTTGRIYKITRISTGQIYIGLTMTSLDARWAQHCYGALNGDLNNRFAEAIREDGPDGFECEILEDGIERGETLKQREAHWIGIFDARGIHGLNTAPAGSLGSLRGKEVEYEGEIFSSFREAGEVLGERLGLNPWVVTTRLARGESLPEQARVHSDHPDAGSNLYRRWLNLMKRHPDAVSGEWTNDFDAFKASVIKTKADGLELIRKNPDKPWGPENFQWVTTKVKIEQTHGKSLSIDGNVYPSIRAAARAFGIGFSTLKNRLHVQGMKPEEAVSKPLSAKLEKREVTIHDRTFLSKNQAVKFLAESEGISEGQAKYRIERGDFEN